MRYQRSPSRILVDSAIAFLTAVADDLCTSVAAIRLRNLRNSRAVSGLVAITIPRFMPLATAFLIGLPFVAVGHSVLCTVLVMAYGALSPNVS